MQDKVPHILVIDDDWMNREVLEAYLTAEKYQVTTAHSGQRGIDLALANPPDLILLDAMLPDLSGFEVCTRMKRSEKLRFVPVVMVTALESEADKLRGVEAGADDFIVKPFSYLLMMTRLRSLIKIKQLHDDLKERTALLHRILNRYVDEEITEVILIDPERYLKLGGESRRVTVVFADISGFTAFAEERSAQEVISVLNQVFSELTELVVKHHGTFDKYIGDEIMAFFGAPVPTGDDTLNAVMMAWEMQQTFRRIRENFPQDFPFMSLEIGLHTGEAAVGNVGSERFMNYTVIGDVVNTAHRLQEIAKHEQILISEVTYHEVKDRIIAERRDPVALPGKREAIVTYEVKGVRT